jgi:hypothetical protein
LAKTIVGSVGINGNNLPGDVKTVQELLNKVPLSSGGPSPLLVVDSVCGQKTKDAIQKFQLKQFGWSGADGRVDPYGQTLAKLNQYDTSVTPPPPEQTLEPKSTKWIIQRCGTKTIFCPEPNEMFFRVLDATNALAALYWFGQTGQSVPAGSVSTSQLAPAQTFYSKGPHELSKLGAVCAYLSTETPGGQRYSNLLLNLSSGALQIPMPQHIIGPGGITTGPGSVSITGTFRFVKFL